MEKLDKKQLQFVKLHRRACILTPQKYAKLLYYKNKEFFDRIIDKYDFEIPDKEREKFILKLYDNFWKKIGFMIYHNIEFKWGWKYINGHRRTLKHPFQITYKPSVWKRKKK